MDISRTKRIYCVGIKGSGLAGLAEILKGLGKDVSGSDTKEKYFTERGLRRFRIPYFEGFDPNHLATKPTPDLVISSVAYAQKVAGSIQSQNPEILKALELGISVLTYPEAVALLFNQSYGIAVCGSHGKSSTTAFLGTLFEKAGLDPIVLVGSEVTAWKSNVRVSALRRRLRRASRRHFFILEADEYRDAFFNYLPKAIVCTNIDWDHPDYFKTPAVYRRSFRRFVRRISDPRQIFSYERFRCRNASYSKPVQYDSSLRFPLYIPGEHFQRNLQLCYALAKKFRIEKHFVSAVIAYTGIKRRFEVVVTTRGITLIDDYGHHPTEVRAFWNSLREKFPNRKIWFVFQPHTYSRTRKLFRGFVSALKIIPTLLLLRTFSSAREKQSPKNALVDRRLHNSIPGSRLFRTQLSATRFLARTVQRGDVVATCGAGDGYKILGELEKLLRL